MLLSTRNVTFKLCASTYIAANSLTHDQEHTSDDFRPQTNVPLNEVTTTREAGGDNHTLGNLEPQLIATDSLTHDQEHTLDDFRPQTNVPLIEVTTTTEAGGGNHTLGNLEPQLRDRISKNHRFYLSIILIFICLAIFYIAYF